MYIIGIYIDSDQKGNSKQVYPDEALSMKGRERKKGRKKRKKDREKERERSGIDW